MDTPIKASTMSKTQGGLMSFDQCQQGCKAEKAKMINKEYFEYLFTVSMISHSRIIQFKSLI